MTGERVEKMTVKEKRWWLKRLAEQKEREAEAMESATKGK